MACCPDETFCRTATALEFTYQLTGGRRVNALVSYVLSRTRGNTSGIFASDYSGGGANVSPQWDDLSLLVNGHGLLPNDRTHVVKLAGSWRSDLGLTVGATFAWMRGTPLNEFGTGPAGTFYNVFLVPRGTAGRTPDIWDLNLRLTYDLAALTGWETSTRLVCDLLHLGSPRKVTNFDQKHYLGRDVDGNQIQPSPTYGLATEYQPPFAARLGVTVDF